LNIEEFDSNIEEFDSNIEEFDLRNYPPSRAKVVKVLGGRTL